MARFDNPTLRHRTRQIAMDGSQKLPQRLLALIAARLAAGQGIAALSLPVAAWMRWQAGRDDLGNAHEIGRAHVRTPVPNAHLVCRVVLEKNKITYEKKTLH